MNKIEMIIIYILLLCLLAGLAFSATGCSDYKKVTLNKDGERFSFEYPKAYKEFASSFQNIEDERQVILLSYFPDTQTYEANREIFIYYSDVEHAFQTAQEWMDEWIEGYLTSDFRFELHDRSTIIISGIDAEVISYSRGFDVTYLSSRYSKCWQIFFESKGKIWALGLISNPEYADQAQQDFYHLAKTFTLLN